MYLKIGLKWSWVPLVALLVAALSLPLPNDALALSCMQPSLDEAGIDGAVVIFEGTAGAKRPLDGFEKAAARSQAANSLSGDSDDLKVASFTVTRGWKGATAGQRLDVLFNGYWGDSFAEGQAYLVVSPKQIEHLVWAPLCGLSTDVDSAEKLGMIDTLERVLGD